MAKFIKVPISENQHQWQFHCPGCEKNHAIVESIHQFNGNINLPSILPSVFYNEETYRCHSFITNGKISFLADCTHKLAGKQNIELPEMKS